MACRVTVGFLKGVVLHGSSEFVQLCIVSVQRSIFTGYSHQYHE
jgi:hypothetical protein